MYQVLISDKQEIRQQRSTITRVARRYGGAHGTPDWGPVVQHGADTAQRVGS